jgi:KipI family sensor histidine kinase inhibitor
VVPLGDLAAYVEFSPTLDLDVNEYVQRLSAAVHAAKSQWVRDVVPALGGLALHFDPAFEGNALDAAAELVAHCMKEGLPKSSEVGREVEVPVCYDAEFALDLPELAQKLKLAPEEIVKRHAAAEYRVMMVGFAPGHPYMSGLDASLAVPRRAVPRAVVPAGSVAIANEQAVIYPYAISGGWSVIGRTPLTVFDANRAEPSLLQAGDRVRFVQVGREAFR